MSETFTPAIGLRVRRLNGERAGMIMTITEIRNEGHTISGRYDNGHSGHFDTENYELAEDAPVADGQFQIGEEVEIVGEGRDLAHVGAPSEHIGLRGVIGSAQEPHDAAHGGYWQRITLTTPEGGQSNFWYPVGCIQRVNAPMPNTFRVGQEVIISDRIREPLEDSHRRDCEVALPFVGQRCTVLSTALSGGRVRFELHVERSRYEWQLPSEYLDVAGVNLTPPASATSFDNAWRLARSGQGVSSLMNELWGHIATPVQSLSRQRGDWSSLIISRAILRLRRQTPNSYEEQLVKGQDLNASRLWSNSWSAATRVIKRQ